MEVLLVVGLVGGTFAAIHLANRSGGGRRAAKVDAASAGRLLHLRSGDFPSSCSWCRGLTLARKQRIFERQAAGWTSFDAMGRLRQCPDAEVAALHQVLTVDHPAWRRLCSDPCVASAISKEAALVADAVVRCEYCGTVSTPANGRCGHCGAASRH